MPAAKLDTPPKERTAAGLPGIKVPPLKLKNAAAPPAPSNENVDAAQRQLAAAAAGAPTAKPAAAAKGGKGGKKPYLTFLPAGKKVRPLALQCAGGWC